MAGPIEGIGRDARRPGPSRYVRAWWGEGPLTQLALFLLIVFGLRYLGSNLVANMRDVGISPGFGFLNHAANLEIGETPIAHQAGDTYGRAILVGLLNTVKVGLAGCVLMPATTASGQSLRAAWLVA
jgi:general L-amino acid transport system permease protein